MTTQIYLSGPMSGLPDHGKAAFERVCASLRARGLKVVSPHELETPLQADWTEREHHYACLRRDIMEMLRCEAILLLPGWPQSKGAMAELNAATAAGLRMYVWDDTHKRMVLQ